MVYTDLIDGLYELSVCRLGAHSVQKTLSSAAGVRLRSVYEYCPVYWDLDSPEPYPSVEQRDDWRSWAMEQVDSEEVRYIITRS